MTNRHAIIGFAIAGSLLVLLIVLAIILQNNSVNLDVLLKEGGIVESASAIGYLLVVAFVLYKGRLRYLQKYSYFVFVIIFFMLRELDFDKRFTSMGIFKSKFFLSSEVPFYEKIAGGLVILLLTYWLISILYFHVKDFYCGLKSRSSVSLGVLIITILLVASKSLDGIARKLKGVGVEISSITSMHATAAEEILELGIPIILLITYSAYFAKTNSNYVMHPDGNSAALHSRR